MKENHHSTSPAVLWLCGLLILLIWLAVSGNSMSEHLQSEHQQYSNRLGQDNAQWISKTGEKIYTAIIKNSGVEHFLIKHTTADGRMGTGLEKSLSFFQGVVINLLNLIKQILYRMSVLLACLPYWGVVLIAAIVDGLLIRKIRYHDFHYTSPLKNLWSRKACQWIPVFFLILIIIPLSLPVLLIPAAAWLTAISLGWWTANWQKKI